VSKKLFSITFIIFLTLVACSKEIIENSPLNDEVIKKLQGAKVIEDIFHKSAIIAAKGNTLYVLKEGTEEEILVSNPTIIGYKLKI